MATKVGEIQTAMIEDVKKTEASKARLRSNWADKALEVPVKLSQDLKKGDKVKFTVEKL